MESAEVIGLDDISLTVKTPSSDKKVNLNEKWESIPNESIPCNRLITFVKSISGIVTSKNPARDNMSNERTMLAYLRTSLNVFFLGVLIIQFTKHTILKPIKVSLGGDLSSYDKDNEVVIFLKNISDLMNKYMNPLGGTVMTLGVIVGIIGVIRYWKIQTLLIKGPDMFEEVWALMLLITIVLVGTVATTFVLIYKV